MKCRSFEEAIVDRARGAPMPPALRTALDSHLGQCAECAAVLRRQEQLTRGLRALARTAAAVNAPDGVEHRLATMFATRSGKTVARPVDTARFGWRRIAAAAGIAVAVGAGWLAADRLYGPDTAAGNSGPERSERALSADAAPARPDKQERPAAAAARQAGQPATTAARQPRGQATAGRGPAVPRPPEGHPSDLDDFIPLPGSAGLPSFESGRIVRVELAVAELPSYGVEIVPDAAGSEVQADLLVGQDGHPRAIRLVIGEPDPRSRQQ